MKIYTKVRLMVLGIVATPSRDGKNTYYKMSVFNKDTNEAGMLKCTEAVALGKPASGQDYECTALYDDTYDPVSFRITAISAALPVPGYTDPAAPQSPDDPKDKPGNRK